MNRRSGRLYRDRENGMLMGVCAGLANYFGVHPLAVRIVAVVVLMMQFLPAVLVYVTAGMLLRDRPLTFNGRSSEQDFWRGSRESWR